MVIVVGFKVADETLAAAHELMQLNSCRGL